jgi:hypothetical protein
MVITVETHSMRLHNTELIKLNALYINLHNPYCSDSKRCAPFVLPVTVYRVYRNPGNVILQLCTRQYYTGSGRET